MIPFGCQTAVSKRRLFNFIFNLGNKAKSQGLNLVSREDGNNNHVASHKLCGFQGCMGGLILIKEPAVVEPKFRSFLSHIFSQASQNVTVQVKVRFHRSVRRNKFMVKNPLHGKKKKKKKSNGHAPC
jgi:hypothetical protein